MSWAADVAQPSAQGPTRAQRLELNRAEALLRRQMERLPEASGVAVVREPERLILRVPARLLFEPDAVALRDDHDASMVLALMRAPLQSRRRLSAQVVVYTDSIGGSSLNQSISAQRAAAIGTALIGRGIEPSQLQTRGAGASEALASNETAVGRAQNRRIEVVYELQSTAPPRASSGSSAAAAMTSGSTQAGAGNSARRRLIAPASI